MRIDSKSFNSLKTNYDIVIIGAGYASITILHDLLYCGARVCVIDILEFSSDDVGSGYVCVADKSDFVCDNGRDSSWPLTFNEVYSEIDRVFRRHRLPKLLSYQKLSGKTKALVGANAGFTVGKCLIQNKISSYCSKFDYLFDNERIDLLSGVSLCGLVGSKGSESVIEGLELSSPNCDRILRLTAKEVVVSSSSWHTAAVLSEAKSEGLLSERLDTLGRFVMNHKKVDLGTVHFVNSLSKQHLFFGNPLERLSERIYFSSKPGLDDKRPESLPYIRLNSVDYNWLVYTKKERSLVEVIKQYRKYSGVVSKFSYFLKKLLDPEVYPGLFSVLFKYSLKKLLRRFSTSVRSATIRGFIDVLPDEEVRFLSTGGVTDEGKKNSYSVEVNALSDLLSKFLASSHSLGIARFNLKQDWKSLENLEDANHVLGGARMGIDPSTGVVGKDFRVFGTRNLYVLGDAIHPVGGAKNPYLTNLALAAKLGVQLCASYSHTSLFREPKVGTKRFTVVGAGRRVCEDVIPVIESLFESGASLNQIYGTGSGTVFGRMAEYTVEPLDVLSEKVILDTDFLYVAVPTQSVESVLGRLLEFDCSTVSLIIDTPVPFQDSVRVLFEMFANVVVAEDCYFLPWLDLFSDEAIASKVYVDRSAYKYHAIAMVKSLLLASSVTSFDSGVTAKFNKDGSVKLLKDGVCVAEVLSPRNYDEGRLDFEANDGVMYSSMVSDGSQTVIQPVITNSRCVGFKTSDRVVELSPVESELIGGFSSDDTIITKMLSLKRAGLFRLVKRCLEGDVPYGVDDAVQDAVLSMPKRELKDRSLF